MNISEKLTDFTVAFTIGFVVGQAYVYLRCCYLRNKSRHKRRTRIRHESPCVKDCAGRSSTCHGSCEKYAEYVKQRKAMRENKWKQSTWTQGKSLAKIKGKMFFVNKDWG